MEYAARRYWEIVRIYEDKQSKTKNNRSGLMKKEKTATGHQPIFFQTYIL